MHRPPSYRRPRIRRPEPLQIKGEPLFHHNVTVHKPPSMESVVKQLRKNFKCGYCSMPGIAACALCGGGLCKKHIAMHDGRAHCRRHVPGYV